MAETSPIESRDALPVASGRAVMVWLWRELRGKRMRVAGILLLFLAEAAAGLIFPVILGFLVDTVIAEVGSGGAGGSSESGHVPTSFWWQLAGLGGAAVASGLLAWAGGAALAKLSETLIAELREAYVKAALNLPRRTVEAAGSGILLPVRPTILPKYPAHCRRCCRVRQCRRLRFCLLPRGWVQ